MAKPSIVAAIQSGRILVSDGAWGTMLQQQGLPPGACPELWCLTHRAEVLDIARSYIAAGADLIESNSFGGTAYKLRHFGLAQPVVEINTAAAAISRAAAGADRWVIAALGPTGQMTAMGDVTEEDFYHAFREQAVALAAGGADALCIETMSALDEAAAAVRAARDHTPCEVLCTFTFARNRQGGYRTMMGVAAAEAARAALAAGAHVIGANCGNGLERMLEVVKEMRAAAPGAPILVQANAGLPKNVNGVDVFSETPADMAACVPALVAAGAQIIGGCCGTTPAHIAAIRQAVDRLGRK
ncbi:MAG: homocysteine S-methyltransferase family protein [Kiritimatiellaeota bacterium]|nr:homocysteine S-methyltransferase family protein [Kiritimatiellota bacterium]